MSQWGEHARSFVADDGEYMIVIVHVAGPVWAPIEDSHPIDDLVLTYGNSYFAHAKMIDLNKEWIGKTYGEWRSAPAAVVPKPDGPGYWDSSTGVRVWCPLEKPDKDEVDSS